MSYLLYCIVRADHEEPRQGIRLLGYPRASIMIRAAGLGAVLSEASRADLAPDVPRLLAYATVIDSFNRDRTVIPMRFGCRFANLTEVARLLERERRHYDDLLHELDGRAEMSVHVIGRYFAAPAVSDSPPPLADGPGAVYLEKRRRYYALRQEAERRDEEIAARICAMARGRFVRHTRAAASGERQGSFAIHFLIPRDGVGSFADALRPMSGAAEPLLKITGPWPPYNFVSPGP